MLGINPSLPIYLCTLPCDMRKSFNGLSGLVVNFMGKKPDTGHVFVFVNRFCNKMKILLWDRHGYWLFYKRLEQGSFQLPFFTQDLKECSFSLNYEELLLIIEGIDLSSISRRKRFTK